MQQWQADRENPKNKEEREKLLKKNAQKQNKVSKKMTVEILANWHELQMSQLEWENNG